MCGLLGGPSVWQEEELGVRIPARNINNVSPHFHWDEMMRRIILVLLIIVMMMTGQTQVKIFHIGFV